MLLQSARVSCSLMWLCAHQFGGPGRGSAQCFIPGLFTREHSCEEVRCHGGEIILNPASHTARVCWLTAGTQQGGLGRRAKRCTPTLKCLFACARACPVRASAYGLHTVLHLMSAGLQLSKRATSSRVTSRSDAYADDGAICSKDTDHALLEPLMCLL